MSFPISHTRYLRFLHLTSFYYSYNIHKYYMPLRHSIVNCSFIASVRNACIQIQILLQSIFDVVNFAESLLRWAHCFCLLFSPKIIVYVWKRGNETAVQIEYGSKRLNYIDPVLLRYWYYLNVRKNFLRFFKSVIVYQGYVRCTGERIPNGRQITPEANCIASKIRRSTRSRESRPRSWFSNTNGDDDYRIICSNDSK